MPRKATKASPTAGKQALPALPPPAKPQRRPNGTWMPGFSGSASTDAARARRSLNLSTIGALQEAFNRGGRQAIDKVMKQQPAIFLKMLVLLVPRELEVTHSGGVKAMSDEQIEATIEAIQAALAKRAGDGAVDVTPTQAPGAAEDVSADKP